MDIIFLTISGESALTTVGEFTLTPILAILMTVGAALILVFVLIAAYFCVRHGPSNGGSRGRKGKVICKWFVKS